MSINVKDASGATISIETPNANGRASAANSKPVTLATEDKTALDLLHTDLVAPTPAGTNIIGRVGVDQTTPGTTNGVVVNSSALPTGAATSAAQTTGNTSLGNIDTAQGAQADAAATSDTGTFSLIALIKRLLRFGAATREYLPTGGYRVATSATAAYLALSGNVTLGASREVRFRATTACWIRFATAGSGQDAAVDTAGAATTSMPLEANQPEVIRIPSGCTHISYVRESADGAITLTPVV